MLESVIAFANTHSCINADSRKRLRDLDTLYFCKISGTRSSTRTPLRSAGELRVSAKGKSVLKPKFMAKLNNGTEVIVRTIDACDKECISNEFDHLSNRSRYLRFCMPINKLSNTQLDYLTDIDNKDHVLIAVTKTVEGTQSGLGLGRYIKLVSNKKIAEFAITVADKYQNRGVGSLLIELLIQHARNNDIKILRGYVLESNKLMHRLLKKNNFKHTGIDDGLPRYDLTI